MQVTDPSGPDADPSEDAGRSASDPSAAAPTVPAWAGALVGILSMAAGLVIGELIAGLRTGAASPVVEVGNRVVDLVPRNVREWAISTFNTSDKAVLVTGVLVILAVVSALAGVWMVRGRRTEALGVVGTVVALGALSPLGRGGAGWGSVLATLLGGVVSGAVLWWLGDRAQMLVEGPPGSPALAARPGEVTRRGFVGAAVGVGAATVVVGGAAAWLRSRAVVAAERLGITLPPAADPLPAIPADVSVDLEGVSPFVTPNDVFYRIDTALVVPRVSIDGWTLRVHGRVRNELSLDYATLLDRPLIEVDATISCVSNVLGGDLVGNARWLGCRLDDLLDEAGIDPSADQIVGRSTDGFTAGFPTAVLDGRDAIVAVGMNGEPLPTDHGYPARLIVPGLYGYVSATKWLSEIELTRFDEFEGYWIPRGWDVEAPVLTQSRIDTPNSRAEVPAGQPLGVGGIAWSPVEGISAVEVQFDEGPWEEAELAAELNGSTWRQWRHTVTPAAGPHTLRVRATDAKGDTQTGEERDPGPNGATGWHEVAITAV